MGKKSTKACVWSRVASNCSEKYLFDVRYLFHAKIDQELFKEKQRGQRTEGTYKKNSDRNMVEERDENQLKVY
ncbi:hypothetical protein HA466_0090800 [Hirschfeldia incana]|nr:hypothetical protein HA466_0090800 [Hirschfeldia incana]